MSDTTPNQFDKPGFYKGDCLPKSDKPTTPSDWRRELAVDVLHNLSVIDVWIPDSRWVAAEKYLADKFQHIEQRVRRETYRECVDIVRGFNTCKFDPRLAPRPSDDMKLVYEIANAIEAAAKKLDERGGE